jgi:hypothetical protein
VCCCIKIKSLFLGLTGSKPPTEGQTTFTGFTDDFLYFLLADDRPRPFSGSIHSCRSPGLL